MPAKDRKATDTAAVLAAIAGMEKADRVMSEQLHAIITANAPSLAPRTWYGMPAYANEKGKIICFFRDRKKFGERYMTLGFNDSAKLDDGAMWPINYALKDLSKAEEKKIAELVKRAVG